MVDAVARMRSRMSVGVTDALRARDRVRLAALRSAMAALDNAEAAPAPTRSSIAPPLVGLGAGDAPRTALDERAVTAVVESEIRAREEAAVEYRALRRSDVAQRLEAEADVLRPYLDVA